MKCIDCDKYCPVWDGLGSKDIEAAGEHLIEYCRNNTPPDSPIDWLREYIVESLKNDGS